MDILNKNEIIPLFTVIIPVKNRGPYLYYTLKTCMIQEYENFEVIVSDDASTDNTQEVVNEAIKKDSRITYYRHNEGIGMRENFEFALKMVKPGYVMALGGDDGLLPDGINDINEIIQTTKLKLLTWAAPLYSYPNVTSTNGQLVLYRQKEKFKIIDSQEFLTRQSKNLHYLSDLENPMFYVKGVVSTELINKVQKRTKDGRFYSCPTPDGYSGIVLAGEVSKFGFSGEPFSIYGMSPSSQGLAYLSNSVKAKQDSENFYKNVVDRSMHEKLASQPYSPLITLMTVDYLLTAKDLPGWEGVISPINYKEVLKKSLNELKHGLYGEERIVRELKILSNISKKHNLDTYFNDLVSKSRRYKGKAPLKGNATNLQALYLEAKPLGVNNIIDAAYASKILFKTQSQITLKSVAEMIFNSVKYRLRSRKKGDVFPSINVWKDFETCQSN